MKRTTVMLPADLKTRAMRVARERGISFGELLRRALEATVQAPPDEYEDPVFADAAVFEGSAPADLAAEHDGYLYGERE
ncbi:MAG: CopG family transcriptional regulator [Acidobacteriota bacterium]|jgi:hypothetical protein